MLLALATAAGRDLVFLQMSTHTSAIPYSCTPPTTQRGADPKAKNGDGQTPAEEADEEEVQKLLQ